MRKLKLFTFLLALVASMGMSWAAPAVAVNGKLPGAFTVNAGGDQVYFSQGNLQYQASTNTWRFAEHQYDFIGNAAGNNTKSGRNTQSDWIDLFGWATSGNSASGTAYQPWQSSTTDSEYGPAITSGQWTYANSDWGINPISNGGNVANSWRTLTQEEWNYILNSRSTDYRFCYAKLNIGVQSYNGLIILPDDWNPSYYALSSMNDGNDSYNSNEITAEDWTNSLEAHGAVFLPVTGMRYNGNEVIGLDDDDKIGFYWSSIAAELHEVIEDPEEGTRNIDIVNAAYNLAFNGGWYIRANQVTTRSRGLAVRLVYTEPSGDPTPTPSGDKLPGVFSVSGTKAVNFSKGNLQYVGGNWKFADNQWDVIGASQADNNRDLFGWGTGDAPNKVSMTLADYAEYHEWGTNMGAGWRTLTYDEWSYIFYTRTSASDLRGSATVCGVHGYIILPDNFVLPGGLSWTPRPNDWTTNVYTSQEWSSMEENGAVFLPAAGYRASTTVIYDESAGYYWSATEHSQAYNAYNVWVADDEDYVKVHYRGRTFGQSVRLVSETAPTPTPTNEQVPTNADPENPTYHYSTFFHSTQNYKLTNDGTQAFIADLSGSDLVLTKIAEGTQVIPANTAVIFRKSGSADPVVLTPTEENGVSVNPNDNSLKGVDAETAITSIDGLTATNCYVLSGTAEYGVGFYRINSENLKAHKAYVVYNGNAAPKRMHFVFNNGQVATDIERVQSEEGVQKRIENGQLIIIRDGVYYNAQGQTVK